MRSFCFFLLVAVVAHFAVQGCFPRVSEEMIFENMNWNPMFCAFLSVQYWTPCLPALLRLFESFCWFLMVFFREWSCRRFLELLLVHSIVASEILASFQSWTCERCVYAWIWWFWYVFFRCGFGLRRWCFLVRVSDFWCKPNTPD